MRKLTLNEKINIKGQLARKGVLPGMLVILDMANAIRLYWNVFGRPASTHSTPKMWRPRNRRRLVTAH